MDNASYHSVVRDKPPTTSTRKSDIQDWLMKKNIPYTCCQTRAELLELVQAAKGIKEFELDIMAANAGHTVVRLPPFHCQYNPIEMVWAQVKRQVADRNTTFKMKDLEDITNQVIDEVTQDAWAACVRHAEQLQDEDLKKEIARDAIMEPIIIQPTESDSENEDTDGREDEEVEILATPLQQ
ncbi:uncharacterized protein LOC124171727 [Ischnura elegans]|uniref:uncharacterized protein LOC124171727 n=1 Tax=Ischnura elegans TaxID=197161 RepID=UPI001ED87953|nr:uncharacterized protein LOC124171727 [Ischnura elegans]